MPTSTSNTTLLTDLQAIIARFPQDRKDRHRLGLGDHTAGPRRDCPACLSDAYLTYVEILDEIIRNGWDVAVREVISPKRVESRGIDAVRRERTARNVPNRPDQAAGAKIVTDSLTSAHAAGDLPQPVETARALFFRVVTFVITPDDRPEVQHAMPWGRLGRDLGPGGRDLTATECRALWDAVELALLCTKSGANHLDRNVSRHSEHVGFAGSDVVEVASVEVEQADPDQARMDRVVMLAIEQVRAGGGPVERVLRALVDREFGGDGRSIDGSVADLIQNVDPKGWRLMVRKVKAAAGPLIQA